MKRRNPKYFTMIELMFVIAILVILVGISWVAGTKVLRGQTEAKTKAEITLLINAIEQYNTRWGVYPHEISNATGYSGNLDFGEYLSKVLPGSGWSGSKRPMYIDYDSADMLVSNSNYADPSATSTNVQDPYENVYKYVLTIDATTGEKSFKVYSFGLNGDDNSGQFTKDPSDNLDDISSDNL